MSGTEKREYPIPMCVCCCTEFCFIFHNYKMLTKLAHIKYYMGFAELTKVAPV